MLFLELQYLHKSKTVAEQKVEAFVDGQKGEVDKRNLILQSLLYEVQHYEKEIRLCQEVGSEIATVPMSTQEEYLKLHPDQVGLDQHSLTLARLKDELEQRKSLVAQLEDLTKTKAALIKQNEEDVSLLGSLQGKVQYLLKKATPLQDSIVSSSETYGKTFIPDSQKELAEAKKLPPQLYFLFASLQSFCSASPVDYEVSISSKGKNGSSKHCVVLTFGSSTSSSAPIEPPTKRRKAGKGAHSKLVDAFMILTFYYFPQHKFVTAKVSAPPKASKAQVATCSNPRLLAHLFPDDAGQEDPHHLVASLENFHGAQHGYPYRWVQSLCGQHCRHPRIPAYPQPSLKLTLTRLVQRFRNRRSLERQCQSLSEGKFNFTSSFPGSSSSLSVSLSTPTPNPTTTATPSVSPSEFYPVKTKAYLASWKHVKERPSLPRGSHGTPDKLSSFFQANMQRGQGKQEKSSLLIYFLSYAAVGETEF